jgi:hypothetical protein
MAGDGAKLLGTVGSMPIMASNSLVPESKTKRKSASGGGSDAKSTSKKAAPTTIGEEGNADGITCIIIVTPDGRLCKVCKLTDKTLDYVMKHMTIKWGKPPKKKGDIWENDGRLHDLISIGTGTQKHSKNF